MNFYAWMQNISATNIENQIVKPGDFYNEEGFLVCGKCREPRQKYMDFPDPTEQDPKRTSPVKITRKCLCEREEEARVAEQEKAKADRQYIEELRSISLIDEKFKDARFEIFEANKYNQKNLKLCQRYAYAFDEMVSKCQGLIFWGGVGTGKSFAAACIANHLLDRKVSVLMTSLVKMIDAVYNGKQSLEDILTRIDRAKLVIFDDLGAERNTAYALEKVYDIIDSRYRNKKPMILTTNLTLSEMQEETDIRYTRIYDRIFEVCYPMQFTGPSWRKKEAFNRFEEMKNFFEDIND